MEASLVQIYSNIKKISTKFLSSFRVFKLQLQFNLIKCLSV